MRGLQSSEPAALFSGEATTTTIKNSRELKNTPTWIRGYLRQFSVFFVLVLSLMISVLVFTIGLSATRAIQTRSDAEMEQYSGDFLVAGSANELMQREIPAIAKGLPPVDSFFYSLGAPAESIVPLDKASEELRAYYPSADRELSLAVTLIGIDRVIYESLGLQDIVSFDEFEKHSWAIALNESLLTYKTGRNQEPSTDGTAMIQGNEPEFYRRRIVDTTELMAGDMLDVMTYSEPRKPISLKIAGITANRKNAISEDIATLDLYIPLDLFNSIYSGEGYYDLLSVRAGANNLNAVRDYLREQAATFGYYFQDNTQLSQSVRLANSIQLRFLSSLMGFSFAIAVLNCVSLWGYEAQRQRKTVAVRRALGISWGQGLVAMVQARAFILACAVILVLSLSVPILLFGGDMASFYGLTPTNFVLSLTVTTIIHGIVILILSFFSNRMHFNGEVAEGLRDD